MQPVYTIFGQHGQAVRHNFTDFTTDDYISEVMNARLAPPEGFAAPLSIMWELTSKCKNRCIYCYNGSSPDRQEQLSDRKLFELANELIEMKPFNVCLTGGEPTENHRYLDLMTLLTSSGIKVSTILSGANLDQHYFDIISKCVSVLQISLDGSRAEIHDAVRGRKGSFAEATNAIREFVSRGIEVRVSFASTGLNIDDFENTYRLCGELGVTSLRTQRLAQTGRASRDTGFSHLPTDEQLQRLDAFLYSHAKVKNPMIEYAEPYLYVTEGLKMGTTTMARITSCGDIGISPYIEAYFGNVNNEPLQAIWNRMKKGWHNPQMNRIGLEVAEHPETLESPLHEKIYIS